MFCYFFRIFYYESGKDETKQYLLFSLLLSLFQPILAWNEAMKEFFNFLIFFDIFLEFSIMCLVRTKRNDNFYFLTVSWFSNRFCIEIKPWWYFLIFFNFVAIFLEYSIMRRVRMERNDNFYYFYGLRCYFFGIFNYGSGRNGSEQ